MNWESLRAAKQAEIRQLATVQLSEVTPSIRSFAQSVTTHKQDLAVIAALKRTDPQTGRKALFLGRRPNSYIVGMEVAASEALLDTLWEHATQSRFAFCHEWQAGDVLMWNNLAVLHRRDPFDANSRRIMHRTQIKGRERIA